LLHGRGAPGVQLQAEIRDGELREPEPHTFRTEDVKKFISSCDLLGRSSYHVVVGNPPYITVKDKRENENYRAYSACSGKYALSVPFTQLFFRLAIRTHGPDRDAGFIGQITANSFMKREFGKKLIEEFFPSVDLSHVIDTSGAYIPGHGTPTVILIGRNRAARQARNIRVVLGVRGEPSQPANPSKGLVWSAIVEQVDKPGSESAWISVEDADRTSLATFPWSLTGGGASTILARLDEHSQKIHNLLNRPIGFASFPGQDEAFFLSKEWFNQHEIPRAMRRALVVGEVVRDWYVNCDQYALVPYSLNQAVVPFDLSTSWGRHLWTMRRVLGSTTSFGGQTRADSAEPWWTWYRWVPERYRTPLSIAFAFVATHNHFVLDRGGKVFNRSAPVIKLPEGASEDDHLTLLGALNSSTACFWLKQVSQAKAGGGTGRGMQDEAWEERYEFTGTKLQEFPLPAELPLDLARALDELAQQLAAQEPPAVCKEVVPTRKRLDAARAEHGHLRGRMIALQEELDWQVYGSYDLLSETETAELKAPQLGAIPDLELGGRAFEIVLARKVADGEMETAWFARHGSTPKTEIPADWPEEYQRIVKIRIDVIVKRHDIALIERPECKRRWAAEPWEKREREALRTWLLDRLEDPALWFALRDGMRQPRALTVNQLADHFRTDDAMHAIAALYAADHLGKRDLSLTQVLVEITADEHVPYLP
ncbi:MAG: BREX-2 system adenine-specific DNA-methyltransferase PglX, partial [bacterium]